MFLFGMASAHAEEPAAPVAQAACQISTASPAVATRVVVKDDSGAIVPGAKVGLRCGTEVRTAETGSDGGVSLSLRPGIYNASVQATGFADLQQQVAIGSNGEVALQVHVGSATDVVNVTATLGFVPYDSNAGSKTNAPLIEVPQSISIVNQQELEARNVITMNEALRYTPGVTADEFGVEPRFDWLMIRGFAAQTFGVFRDGMRFNSLAGKLDPYELESVEILHGPSSVLYGETPPGGLINQVSKRPQAERHTEVGAQVGAYSRREGFADTTGSFDRNDVWRYRLLGVLRDSDTQTNYTPDNRRMIAPSLTWHPSDRTNITVLTDWQHDGNRWSQFLPASGTLFNNNPNGIIPVSVFLGEPGLEYAKRDQASAGFTGDHLFTDGWNIHSNYRFQYINFLGRTFYGTGFDTTIPNNTTLVGRSAYGYTNGDHMNTQDTRALRRFHTGNWEQTVLFGYDFQNIRIRETDGLGAATDINIYHPVYGTMTAFPTLSYYLNNNSVLKQHGLYAQDQIKFRNHLIFTLGGRQDFAQNDITAVSTNTKSGHLDERFTGRVGVAYLTSSGISPYFAYSTSFLPNAGTSVVTSATSAGTTPAKPSDARQVEGGVKFQPRTWNSYLTASLFQINETNVIVSDAAFLSHQSGEVRSRGVELEGVASLSKGLNLHASYTLTATNTVNDVTPANIGKWLPQTPRNQFAAIADYTVPGGHFAGLGGNFGVRFVGKNAADSANSFFVGSYALMDAGVRFGYRGALLSVNATNLADKRYVATCSGSSFCYYGYARNVIGAVKYRF